MKEVMEILQTWSGIVLLLILAVIGIIMSLAGSSSADERRLSGKDDDHYVLRLPIGRVVFPLALLAAGIVLEFVCNLLQDRIFPGQDWLPLVIKLAIAVIFGLLFWVQLAKVLRRRVFVNGDRIVVTPAIGATIETNYKQIRTVANIHAGKERGVIGKKIRTKEGNRFEVINTMAGYDRFCDQLSEKVELPDLTKKLFKKRDKKAIPEKEPEEVVSHEPLPQASPVSEMPAASPAFSHEPEPAAEAPVETFPEPSAETNTYLTDTEPIPEETETAVEAESIPAAEEAEAAYETESAPAAEEAEAAFEAEITPEAEEAGTAFEAEITPEAEEAGTVFETENAPAQDAVPQEAEDPAASAEVSPAGEEAPQDEIP